MALTNNGFSSFGALLKDFRKRRHLTQQQLAEAIGVHRSAIVRWEQGDFLPESKAMVLELTRHLHLDDQETRHLLEASLTALSPYWLVPLPRNLFFTGREEILGALHTQLGNDQAVVLTQSSALHGLGGVGKTQIALEYAYRHALEYSAVFWIGAETEEQIISSLLHIAEMLQLPGRDNKDQQQVVTAVQRWLTTHNQWLLIWDNVEDLTLLDRFLPAVRSGTILITTRIQALGTFARGVDLLPMEREEGILFLLRRAKLLVPEATHEQVLQFAVQVPAHYAAAVDLVTDMGGLPLALDQAGAYLETTQCGLPTYLELFRARRITLLQQRGEASRDHPASVATTFTLAITTTAQCHPAVWDLLQICALLQPDAIPEELFHLGVEHLGTTLEVACRDELEWNRVVAIACAYSLLLRQPETHTLSMHRLVQAVLLDTVTEAERKQWMMRVIEALGAIFPDVEHATWGQCERLLPHALLCLHRAGPAEETLVLALLAFKSACYLRVRGRYVEAEPLFQRALHIREQVSGPKHPDVARSLVYLAILSREQGKYEEAEPLFQRGLHIQEQTMGADHPQVAYTLNNLAILYWEQGKYEETEPLFQRALSIWEQAMGEDYPQVAYTLNNLGLLYKSQGKYAEAESVFQRALFIHIQKQNLGTDHLDVAFPLNNLAALYWELGKYAEAEPLFQRALHIWEQAVGADHPDTARALNNLAAVYRVRGKYAEAEPLFQRALHTWEQAVGANHPLVAHTLEDMGELYKDQDKYVVAEPLFQRSLQIREQTLGQEHPHTARALNNLAIIYRLQGKYAEAEPLFQRALSIREQHLGQYHPDTGETLHDLAVLRQKRSNLCEAISLAERALTIRSQSLGDTHPKTIATRTLYTQLLQEQKVLEKKGSSSKQWAGSQIMPGALEQLPIPTTNVVVRGVNNQVAYTRTVRMREVTFTCSVCGQAVTQWHYPSGRIKYCSDACRTVKASQMQEKRVTQQREKRRRERESNL